MIKEEKIKAVDELKKMIERYPVIGLLDMHKMPSKQLQEIRKKIRGKSIIKMTKKSILKLAIKNAKKEGLNELEKNIPQQPAIVFTEIEPFKFYRIIDEMKSPIAAKAGDIAIKDIKVSVGPTNLMPGPVISELTKVGIPVGVEDGKIVIKKDDVIVKKDDVISAELANALRKLNIEPMEVGLNIIAILDKGKIYKKDVLNLVGKNYINRLKEALNNALNLSVVLCYPTKENIKFLLSKAFNNAKAIKSRIEIKKDNKHKEVENGEVSNPEKLK